ncbi:UNVERIFIED_CONTAM: hypothetical protein FKN15_035251 [Acipenser sinensis]
MFAGCRTQRHALLVYFVCVHFRVLASHHWEGNRGKETVRKNPVSKTATEEEIKSYAMNWLWYSKDGNGGRQQRTDARQNAERDFSVMFF